MIEGQAAMNERAFIKSCIKVAGFILLVWGLLGAVNYSAATALYWCQGKMIERVMDDFPDKDDSKSSAMVSTTCRNYIVHSAGRIPGNLMYFFTGLYLCRRYQRPLKWLLKDEPTVG